MASTSLCTNYISSRGAEICVRGANAPRNIENPIEHWRNFLRRAGWPLRVFCAWSGGWWRGGGRQVRRGLGGVPAVDSRTWSVEGVCVCPWGALSLYVRFLSSPLLSWSQTAGPSRPKQAVPAGTRDEISNIPPNISRRNVVSAQTCSV